MLMGYLQMLPTEYLIESSALSLCTVDIVSNIMDSIEAWAWWRRNNTAYPTRYYLACWHFFELITFLGIPPVPATFFMLILEDVYGFVFSLLTAGYGELINTLVYAIDLLFTTYAFISDAFFLLENTIAHATNSIVANAVSTALKFLLCVCFLIFARGGIPRYRFDYLTRLG